MTVKFLRSALAYDAETGIFVWLAPRPGVIVGAVAGSVNVGGYIGIELRRRNYPAHRLAWLYVHGQWPSEEIDHINRDRQDNRMRNLREATHAENQINRAVSSNKHGLMGVAFRKKTGKFFSTIRYDGKTHYLGSFPTKEEAHAAFMAARARRWGHLSAPVPEGISAS